MNYPALSKKVQDHVVSFFHSRKDKTFYYHNIDHTQSVVKAAMQIANHYQLNEKDFFIVTTAAWFHDAGYFEEYEHHEKKGAEMAGVFLRTQDVEEDIIQSVAECILATHMPQNARNRLEEIVCDADLFHLGTDSFFETNKLMRKEAEAKKGRMISKDEWRRGTIRLFEMHHYYTDYCQVLLNDKKKEILEKMKSKSAEKEVKAMAASGILQSSPAQISLVPVITDAAASQQDEANGKKKKEPRRNRPDRGIETMFRLTSSNNQKLSDMADNKAHIMITVNSIILSAVISLLLRKLDEYDFLRWPTYLILVVCVVTIIFSILATRPSLPVGRFTQMDIDQKKVNLLFFGNFYRMKLEDYASGMLQMMEDRDFLYGTLIKDIFSQGVVLGRKYRLLRISYNIFMFGLIASVIAFVVSTVLYGK